MTVFDHPEFAGHEQVLFCHDEDAGLSAIIAVHSTRLGPAAGGCRMHPYSSFDEALADALRLAQGMSYKNALAGLPLGGGKCVIVADPRAPGKHDLLRAFGPHVQSLGGRYWTAIDVGVAPKDADVLAERCDFVFANAARYEGNFNPSTFTALGGFTCLRAATRAALGRDLDGLRVAVQGLGATGMELARLLHEAGAELVVADLDAEAVAQAADRFDARAVAPDAIHAQEVDALAPCALGGVLDDASLPRIRAKVVCGVANNQLAEPRHGHAAAAAGITYVPDYVANSGGMICVGGQIGSHPLTSGVTDAATLEAARQRVLALEEVATEIVERAAREERPTSEVADSLARERMARGPT